MLWERWVLRIPFYGLYQRDRMIAQLCRTLFVLLSVGAPLDKAILGCINLPEKRVWREALAYARIKVISGVSFAEALAETNCFPESFIQLVHVGSSGGSLIEMLPKAAVYFNAQAGLRSEKMLQLMQPLLMTLVAICVGGIAVALLLPLYGQMDLIRNLSDLR
jgi:type IV pilus assembly protein PilC